MPSQNRKNRFTRPSRLSAETILAHSQVWFFNTCSNIALAVVAHTATKPVSKRHLMRNTVEIGLDRWQSLDTEAWILIVGRLRGENARPKPGNPMPHRRSAVFAAKAHFIRDKASRGRLIMPCGTGKSLTAHWIAEALRAKTVLVAVPAGHFSPAYAARCRML
jgi:hypothetical protein